MASLVGFMIFVPVIVVMWAWAAVVIYALWSTLKEDLE